MANKNDNYYLINGDEIESRTIYVPYKGGYHKNVSDISDMDIATIELGTSFKDELKDANPIVKLGNQFYIGKYPYVKGIKIFKPVEIIKTSDDTNKIITTFREFAEERNFYYYHDKSLDIPNKEKVLELAYTILKSLTPAQKKILLSKESILGKDTKHNFINNKHLFEEQISNYTQLICI